MSQTKGHLLGHPWKCHLWTKSSLGFLILNLPMDYPTHIISFMNSLCPFYVLINIFKELHWLMEPLTFYALRLFLIMKWFQDFPVIINPQNMEIKISMAWAIMVHNMVPTIAHEFMQWVQINVTYQIMVCLVHMHFNFCLLCYVSTFLVYHIFQKSKKYRKPKIKNIWSCVYLNHVLFLSLNDLTMGKEFLDGFQRIRWFFYYDTQWTLGVSFLNLTSRGRYFPAPSIDLLMMISIFIVRQL